MGISATAPVEMPTLGRQPNGSAKGIRMTVRDIEDDYRRAYEFEHATYSAAGLTARAAAVRSVIDGDRSEGEMPRRRGPGRPPKVAQPVVDATVDVPPMADGQSVGDDRT